MPPGQYHWAQQSNTSEDESHILVNLDGDNIMGEKFIPNILQTFAGTVDSSHWKGTESTTTVRILLTAKLFLHLRGYDEDLPYGSGSQDRDL